MEVDFFLQLNAVFIIKFYTFSALPSMTTHLRYGRCKLHKSLSKQLFFLVFPNLATMCMKYEKTCKIVLFKNKQRLYSTNKIKAKLIVQSFSTFSPLSAEFAAKFAKLLRNTSLAGSVFCVTSIACAIFSFRMHFAIFSSHLICIFFSSIEDFKFVTLHAKKEEIWLAKNFVLVTRSMYKKYFTHLSERNVCDWIYSTYFVK